MPRVEESCKNTMQTPPTDRSWIRRATAGALLTAAALYGVLAGCHPKEEVTPTGGYKAPPIAPVSVRFRDVTEQAGIKFKHVNGALGQKWLPETMGSGVAWIDYNGDGYQDLFLVNSREWTAEERKVGKADSGKGGESGIVTC